MSTALRRHFMGDGPNTLDPLGRRFSDVQPVPLFAANLARELLFRLPRLSGASYRSPWAFHRQPQPIFWLVARGSMCELRRRVPSLCRQKRL